MPRGGPDGARRPCPAWSHLIGHPYSGRMRAQLYVNPSCSKCRTALSLLEEHHMEADDGPLSRRAPDRGRPKRLMRCSASTTRA